MSIGNAASAYERFLLENATRISSIESTLRSLSWFLPGRFQDSELASEALYSILNIVSLYHDSLLHRSLPSLPASARPNPSSHARYTRFCSSTSTTYAALARTLTILSYSELFIEMAIKKRLGKEKAEKAVMIIEMAKALMRLALLNETDGRLGVSPPIPEREVDPALFDQHKRVVVLEENSARIEYPRSSADVLLGARGEEEVVGVAEKEYWLGSRTGYSRPTLASIRPPVDPLLGNATSSLGGKEIIQQYLMSRVLTAEDAKRPEDLVAKMNRLGKLAEIVWILRPVIYVAAMKKYGRRHAFPFLLSLSLEYFAYSLRQSSTTNSLSSDKASGPMISRNLSEVEKNEATKRARKFWWYFLRGPMWDGWTKPKIVGISAALEGKPILGFLSTFVQDYLPLIDEYHFYSN